MDEKGGLAIGGGVMMGLGIGFFFIKTNPLIFVGCLIAGIGVGLTIAALISSKKK